MKVISNIIWVKGLLFKYFIKFTLDRTLCQDEYTSLSKGVPKNLRLRRTTFFSSKNYLVEVI